VGQGFSDSNCCSRLKLTLLDQRNISMSDMLWTAPEILVERNKEGPAVFVPGTQKGDVYSFAVIAQEMLCRKGPFGIADDNQPHPKGS